MEENRNLTTMQPDGQQNGLIKWLRVLLVAQSVVLVNIVLAPVQLPLRLVGWITMAMTAVTIAALRCLGTVNERYKKAALYLGIGLAGDLVSEFTGVSLIASLVSICSVVGQYQEYHAHSELASGYDPALGEKWKSLFYWQLGVGLMGGLVSVVGVVIAAGMDIPENTIVTTVLAVVALMTGAVQLVYLRYLKRTLGFFTVNNEGIFG